MTGGDFGLNLHQLAATSALVAFGDLIRQVIGSSALFPGICKHPDMIELLLADEVHESLERLVVLTGKPDYKGGPERHLRHTAPNAIQQSAECVTGTFSPHRTK